VREDAADYIHEGDKTYSISEFRVLAVVRQQPDDDAVAPESTPFAMLMDYF
jgi:hypothetical protein